MERYGSGRRNGDTTLGEHKTDRFAHNESWEGQRRPYIDAADEELREMIGDDRTRLNDLERFAEQAKGAGITLGAMLGGGILVIIAHLLHLV